MFDTEQRDDLEVVDKECSVAIFAAPRIFLEFVLSTLIYWGIICYNAYGKQNTNDDNDCDSNDGK